MKDLIRLSQDKSKTVLMCLLGSFLLMSAPSCSAQPVQQRLRHYIESFSAERFQGSVLVAKDGDVLFSGGFGFADYTWNIRNDASTVFRLGSLSKQFTAAAILQLVAEGKLELDRPVGVYWDQLESSIFDQITIHQLLSHTSGLPLDIVAFSDGTSRDLETIREFYSSEQLLSLVKQQALQFVPGKDWQYSNVGYVLLALLLEHIDGQPFAVSLQKRIFSPLAMSNTRHAVQRQPTLKLAQGYELPPYSKPESAPLMDPSFAMGSGSLVSSVEDLFRWERALRDNQVLPKRLTEAMHTVVRNNFAYGWRIDRYNRPTGSGVVAQHRGSLPGFSNTIDRYLDDDIVIILLSNQAVLRDLLNLRDGTASLLLGDTPVVPSPPLPRPVVEALKQIGVAEAVRVYRQQVTQTVNQHETDLNDLGYFELAMNRNMVALTYFKLAVQLFPHSANTHDSLGEVLLSMGDLRAAQESYRKALEISPDLATVKVALARIEEMLRTYKK